MERLKPLGLTSAEAKAYLSVVKLGLCTANQVARDSGLQRTDIYRLMSRLSTLGLIEETLDTPKRYKARDIEESVRRLSAKITLELAKVSKETAQIISNLKTLSKISYQQVEPHVRIVTGLPNIQHNFQDALGKASEDVWVIAPRLFTSTRTIALLTQIVATRHLKVRMILPVDDTNLKTARRLSSTIDIRHHAQLSVHFYGTDNQYVSAGLNIPTKNSQDQFQELITTYPDYVKTMHEFFEMIWKQATPLEIHARSLRARRDSRGFTNVIWGREAIYNMSRWEREAKHRLAVITTPRGPERILKHFGKFYTTLRERGVRVKIICTFTPENARFVKELGTLAEVRHNDCLFGVAIAVLDNSEALIHYISPDSTESLSSTDMALHTTNMTVARQLARIFDAWWLRSIPIEDKLRRSRRVDRKHHRN